MGTLLLIALAAGVIAYVFYEEYRLRLRAPIIGLIAVLAVSHTMPVVGCAINMSPTTLMTFDWKVYQYQYGLCVSAEEINEAFGG